MAGRGALSQSHAARGYWRQINYVCCVTTFNVIEIEVDGDGGGGGEVVKPKRGCVRQLLRRRLRPRLRRRYSRGSSAAAVLYCAVCAERPPQ